jgi:hypothetical protein
VIVTRAHLFSIPGYSARPGFCRGGARAWFRAHGMDWTDFVRNGIAADALTATGDGLALALVDWAQQCAAQEAADGRQ